MTYPMRGLDYILLTPEHLRPHRAHFTFYALSYVFSMAALMRLCAIFRYASYREPEHPDDQRRLIEIACEITDRVCDRHQPPLYVPAEEYAGEPGLCISAYDLYHNPDTQTLDALADILFDAGYHVLAVVVLFEEPQVLELAASRLR
ncbi:MAG: hypothetical protein ACP5JG_07055 [Anaerolineae bacterium]